MIRFKPFINEEADGEFSHPLEIVEEKCEALNETITKSCPAHPYHKTLVIVTYEEDAFSYKAVSCCCDAFEAEVKFFLQNEDNIK